MVNDAYYALTFTEQLHTNTVSTVTITRTEKQSFLQ